MNKVYFVNFISPLFPADILTANIWASSQKAANEFLQNTFNSDPNCNAKVIE